MASKETREYRIISSDGHTIEPPHMWERYLPKKFHAQMPAHTPTGSRSTKFHETAGKSTHGSGS